MYQPKNNFDGDQNQNSSQETDNIDANLSQKNVAIRKKQLESIFIKLIAFGLAVGAILGVGTYHLLNKLGLTKKPYQLEQKRQKPQQETPFNEIQLPQLQNFWHNSKL